MVIARTPLRISIVGGGTDLPVWSKKHGCMFVSAAIDKYIYTTIHYSKYNPKIRIRYSKMEEVDVLDDVQNEIVRETLRMEDIRGAIEITSHAEIPSGTGLGSSGAFGVGLIHALNLHYQKSELARKASYVQMVLLGYPIGIQDQFATAYGGINAYELGKNQITVSGINCNLEDKLVLFYTGIKRDANEVLNQSSTKGLQKIQDLAWAFRKNPDDYGLILNEHWEYKKKRGGMTNCQIDKWYDLALQNGAIGGKLVGAGGGGFLLFYTNDREKLINSMPLMYQPFRFDYEGSKIIYENIS
jgi:D-glycero-alpha-D-manno-heptose-7-phosphate kinase